MDELLKNNDNHLDLTPSSGLFTVEIRDFTWQFIAVTFALAHYTV